mgnify:CR=1 FL=1
MKLKSFIACLGVNIESSRSYRTQIHPIEADTYMRHIAFLGNCHNLTFWLNVCHYSL